MQHEHLTNNEIRAIRAFNTENQGGLAIGYSSRKRVFTLKNAIGQVIDSNPEVWDLIDSALEAEQNRIDCHRCKIAA